MGNGAPGTRADGPRPFCEARQYALLAGMVGTSTRGTSD
jgi:hypothetical protein